MPVKDFDPVQAALDHASSEADRIKDVQRDLEHAISMAEDAWAEYVGEEHERRKLSDATHRLLDVCHSLVDGGVFDLQDLKQALRDYDGI